MENQNNIDITPNNPNKTLPKIIVLIVIMIGFLIVGLGGYIIGIKMSQQKNNNFNLNSKASSEKPNPTQKLITITPSQLAQDATKTLTLKVDVLETDFGIEGMTEPIYPQQLTITVPATITSSLSAYGGAGYIVVAPSGWVGKGNIGANGSTLISLYPIGDSQMVEVSIGSTGTNGPLYSAAPYFPWIRENWDELAKVSTPPTPPVGIQITTTDNPHLVRYSLPIDYNGYQTWGVVFSDVQDHIKDGQWSTIKMEVILLPDQDKLAQALLDIFIQQQNLNNK